MTRSFSPLPSLAVAIAVLIGLHAACSQPEQTQRQTPASSTRSSPTAESIREIVQAASKAPPVIFIGLDGADWQLLDEYMTSSVMPNLQRLTAEGTAGTLETLHPPLSPLVWTTMMTGVDPVRHKILDFVRFNPVSKQREPITSDERRVPAIWNMATWGGRRIGVFGLWATYPAEAVNGLMVSDRLFGFLFKEDNPPEGIVFPRDEERWVRSSAERVERSVDFVELKKYLPWLTYGQYAEATASDDPYSHPVSALRRILIETRIYDTLAKDWIERNEPDLAIVYLQGTDSIGHTFAPFAPPRQASIDLLDYDRYHAVPERYFAEIDTLIGRYRQIAERRGATLMLASDHGFAWGADRPAELSSNAQATAAKWHHRQGIYLLWGPGIPKRGRDATASGSVGQVCSTLLALSGLPLRVGDTTELLPGVPVVAAQSVDYNVFYRPNAPAAVAKNATRAVDEDALKKLKSLGYISEGATNGRRTVETTRTAGSYNNEGLVLKSQGRTPEAATAFENALIVDPNLASALWNLSDLLFQKPADLDRSDALLVRAFAVGLPDGTKFLIGRAIGYQRAGQLGRSVALLQGALAAQPDSIEARLFLGRYRVEAGDCRGAVSDLEKATQLAPRNAGAFASLGLARLCAGDRAAARRDLEHSLQIDPTQAPVRAYLKKLGV